MTPEQWEAIKELLQRLEAMSPHVRGAHLHALSLTDPQLAAEVRQMIQQETGTCLIPDALPQELIEQVIHKHELFGHLERGSSSGTGEPSGRLPDLGSDSRLVLAVTAGPHQGMVFHFTDHDTFLVGRSSHAHFRLPAKDEHFSRIHFLVEWNAPHCRLMDMGSTNGTYVNGNKVTVIDLKDGDVIRVGQMSIMVTIVDHCESPAH